MSPYFFTWTKLNQKKLAMSIKIEVKAWIHGRRRMLFERVKKKKETKTASLLREILDYYFENHPDAKIK